MAVTDKNEKIFKLEKLVTENKLAKYSHKRN